MRMAVPEGAAEGSDRLDVSGRADAYASVQVGSMRRGGARLEVGPYVVSERSRNRSRPKTRDA